MDNCLINEKLEYFLQKVLDIDKAIEKYSKSAELNEIQTEPLTEIKNYVSNLIRDIEKSITEFSEWSQAFNTNMKNISHNPKGCIFKLLLKEIQIPLSSQELQAKTSYFLKSPNIPEIEWDFRKTCSLYENISYTNNLELNQAYQNYVDLYHQNTSLYLIETDKTNNNNLFGTQIDEYCRASLSVYDTEYEKEGKKALEALPKLSHSTCIAQLPNGDLFCFGKENPVSGIALIIDRNYRIRMLPSGTPCYLSSAIYFNKNIYCFGGRYNVMCSANLSERFELAENRWTKLASMPKSDYSCHSVIFNGNILISGFSNKNLLLYTTAINSFSTILYDFGENKQKALINAGRLYLIEFCIGMVYESEASNEYSWNPIAKSITRKENPIRAYCSYNKSGIYIGELFFDGRSMSTKYYKFDLIRKTMLKLEKSDL